MANARKVKKHIKRQIREANEAKRRINEEHMASRTMVSLFKVVAIREWIELLEQELEKLKQKNEREDKDEIRGHGPASDSGFEASYC